MITNITSVKPTVHDVADTGGTELERLQKTLLKLMKKVEDLSKEQSPDVKERLKSLQLQIQNTEQRIQQIQTEAADKERERHRQTQDHDQSTPIATSATLPSASAKGQHGAIIDTHA
jgi:chromosome segregation ATPase